jgi:alkylhydroperoxidase/carboxymuconolactone decarboxylase family protein YurZ
MTERFISDAGQRTGAELMGEAGPEALEANAQRWVTRVDESWARILSNFVINGMYSRDVLPTSTRELCAVAALAVLGRSDELEAHIRMALRTNPPDQVREVILQMAVYGGVPVALEGMKIFERTLEESGPHTAV